MENIQKPIELSMQELSERIIEECNHSGLPLYFVDTVLKGLYENIHVQYTNDLKNRIQEYSKTLVDNEESDNKNE